MRCARLVKAVLVSSLLVAAMLPASASARPLHTLTATSCIDDNDTGPETCSAETDGLNSATGVAVSPDGSSVYIASDGDDAIVHLRRAADGTLTPAGCIDDPDAPPLGGPDTCAQEANALRAVADVAVSPDGRSVYAASRLGDDAIVRFDRAEDGSLTPAGCIDDNDSGLDTCAESTNGLGGALSVAVSADGRSVYAASVNDEAIVRFDRAPDGALTPAGCIDDNDTGPDTCAESTDGLGGAASVTVTSDGRDVLATGLSDDALVRFIRAPSGALTPADCIDDNDSGPDDCAQSADGLDGNTGLATSPDGASVYTAASRDEAVVRFDRSLAGTLTPAGCVDDNDTGPETCAASANGLGTAFSVEVSGDGASVYTAAAADDAVARFDRSADGALTPNGCIEDTGSPDACAGDSNALAGAGGIAVSEDDGAVLVAAHIDDAIVRIDREVPPRCFGSSSAGAPGATQTVPLDCVDPNGDPTQLTVLRRPDHGTLGRIDTAAATVAYTPAPGFSGPDEFTYLATADGKPSQPATATVLVQPPTPALGPQGPPGAPGPQGPPGPPGQDTARLVALLGQDSFRLRSGRRLRIPLAATTPGSSTIAIKRRGRTLVRLRRSVRAGKTIVRWNGRLPRRPGRRAAPIAAGRYTIALTVAGNDDQRASDSARLIVTRR